MERAAAALKLVQQDVRYVYVGISGGNLTPASADETWERRYGDCKGKTVLLLALLAELGITAEPVLVSNAGIDDGLNERLPGPNFFDHVLVRAKIDGVDHFMDGTLPPVATPSPLPVKPYKFLLALSDQGHDLEQLPWRAMDKPMLTNLYEIDARAGFDEPATITWTIVQRGIGGLQQYVEYSAKTRDEMMNELRQSVTNGTWQTLESATWRYDQAERASVLTLTGTNIIDWNKDSNGNRDASWPGGGFSEPSRMTRPADQDQTIPFFVDQAYGCYVTTLRIPAGTTLPQWATDERVESKFFGVRYYREFGLKDGSVRMIESKRTEDNEISVEAAVKDNKRIAEFNDDIPSIYFDKAYTKSTFKRDRNARATYEGDWVADTRDCSPDTTPSSKN